MQNITDNPTVSDKQLQAGLSRNLDCKFRRAACKPNKKKNTYIHTNNGDFTIIWYPRVGVNTADKFM